MALISTLQLGYSGLGGFTSFGSPLAQSVTTGVLATQVRASGSAPNDGVISTASYDWRGDTVVWEFAAVGTVESYVGGHGIAGAPIVIHLTNGTTYYGTTDATGGFSNLLSTRTGNFRYGRITTNAGSTSCTFELSTDGSSWAESYVHSSSVPDLSAIKLVVYGAPTSGSPTYSVNRVNAAATGGSVAFRPYYITG